MSSDSDPLVAPGVAPDGLAGIMFGAASEIQFKLFAFILVIFVFLNSDVFINRVLSRFDGAIDGKSTTSWGVMVQGIILVLCAIIVDVLITHGVV